MPTKIYYRPEWTCGRCNNKARAALYYNLIEGMSYYFEDASADVIGAVLQSPRNGVVKVAEVAEQTGIAEESIASFFEELSTLNLLTTAVPTPAGIADYRKQVSAYNCNRAQAQAQEQTTVDKLPMAISNAEMEYTNRVGGVTSVMMELTYNCSEQCIHCYNPGATRNDDEKSRRGDREELNLEDYKRIIDQLYEAGLVKVCLSGGDPFSKPIAWDIIEYLYIKGVATDIFTNGQRIVHDVEQLANFYPRLVGVSIYSGVAAEHDYITRIRGSWEKSMSVVRQLSALAVPMNLKCCVMRPNVKHYWMVADIAQQYGAEPQFEINISDSVEGDLCARNLRLTPEQYEIILRDDNIKLYVGPEAPNFGGQAKDLSHPGCGAGANSYCISPEGNLMPCCSFHQSFGNLKHQSLTEVLKSEDLNKWQHLTLQQYEDCGRLDYCAYCNLCPGLNFGEHGTPTRASENCCFTAKIRYSLATRMMQGYDPLHGRSVKECLAALPDYRPERLSRVYNGHPMDGNEIDGRWVSEVPQETPHSSL